MRLKTRDTSLGRLQESYVDGTLTISSDSRGVAWVEADAKGRQRVMRDGTAGKLHHAVGIEAGLCFCPRGRRFAYAAAEKSLFGKVTWKVHLDQAEGSGYTSIAAGSLAFSPDSRRLAYAAQKGESVHVVLDGAEAPLSFDRVVPGSVQFSRNGRRFAYVGARGPDLVAVVDGKEYGPWAVVDALTLSADGKRFAFGAFDGRESCVVVDGEAGTPFDDILMETLRFSPDGSRVAFAARRVDTWYAVVDGEAGSPRTGVGERFFTLGAGGELLCDTMRGERRRLLHGDWESDEYDDFAEGSFVTSADGSRFACVALNRGQPSLLIDREERAIDGDGVQAESLQFSPDGRRFGLGVEKAGRWHLVVDGTALPACDRLANVRWNFSPDGQRVAWVAERDGHAVLMVDDQEGPGFDSVCAPAVEFEGPARVRTVVRRGDEIVRLDVAILE